MSVQRQELYLNLIDQLLRCPNGEEPEVLDRHPELLDAGLVQAMAQAAAYFAHHDNPDAAKFLIHVARELVKGLGLDEQGNPPPQSEAAIAPT